jgi:hypothetical protein
MCMQSLVSYYLLIIIVLSILQALAEEAKARYDKATFKVVDLVRNIYNEIKTIQGTFTRTTNQREA